MCQWEHLTLGSVAIKEPLVKEVAAEFYRSSSIRSVLSRVSLCFQGRFLKGKTLSLNATSVRDRCLYQDIGSQDD